MPNVPPPGAERMRALAAALPDGLEEGFRNGRALALPPSRGGNRVYAVGMGGSAIAADLARGVLEAETPWSLDVVRSPDLPGAVNAGAHVLLTSYSGNTWETLRAYDQAARSGAGRVVIASGGELARRAERDRVPVLSLAPGVPPRSAVGPMLGGLLGLLDAAFPESNEGRVARAADALRDTIPRFARDAGPAARLAERIGDRLPFVYASPSFAALARRWKTQFEENAKRVAAFDEIPEAMHNALVGWDAASPRDARGRAAVLLRWSGDEQTVRRSFDYFERLLASRGVRVVSVDLPSEDRLGALLTGIALGDHASLFLADESSIDPLPVRAIDRLKAHMARATAAAPSRRTGRR